MKPAGAFGSAVVLMCGKALAFGVGLLVPLILVRALTQAEFGAYKQLFLVYATCLAIAQWGMAESLFYFAPLEPRRTGRYVANTCLFLLVAGLVCYTAFVAGQAALAKLLNNAGLASCFGLLGIFTCLTIVSAPLEKVMIARKEYVAASATFALSDLVKAALLVAPVALFAGGVRGLLLGACLFGAARLLAALVYLRHALPRDFRPDGRALREQLAYAAPFGLAVFVELLQTSLPHYAVAHQVEAAVFAVYAAGCLQIPLAEFLATSAGNVLMVNLAEQARQGRRVEMLLLWQETTLKLAVALLPVVVMLAACAPEIVVVLFTANYAASAGILQVWCLHHLFSALQTDAVLRARAETRFLLLANLGGLLFAAVTIAPALKAFGPAGAAGVAVATLAGMKIAGLARIRTILSVPWSGLLPVAPLARIAACAMAAVLPVLALRREVAWPPLLFLAAAGVLYGVSYWVLAVVFRLWPASRPAIPDPAEAPCAVLPES
jgi:O-antigen/teichoic acid export membrane protein